MLSRFPLHRALGEEWDRDKWLDPPPNSLHRALGEEWDKDKRLDPQLAKLPGPLTNFTPLAKQLSIHGA